ncbi:alpha/beta fold hydrolase [Brevibacterium marinum]|uniref:Pimeloyl-ACP methyl ester carboxylesterase n=1 Tax=Brevibacterium marinum TaxID=418643 RepID=A0A846RVX9_9MICO|nr:alpha/beta hydrolase [Brevibacterium marinum]NJC55200.1 pimeloyl-ACP methyl ester carboxylesterase [Brevibacterium marinum]
MRDAAADLGESIRIPQSEGVLRVITRGVKGPPVLLLSGAGNDNISLSWRRAIPVLAESHCVYALDWPKQGGSVPWDGVADHERMLRCIDAVLDHFDLDEVSLVGLSQGGAIALGYAIERPQSVDRLVTLAPGGVISFPPVIHQLLWVMAKSQFLNRTLPSWIFRSRAACAWFARTSLFAGPVNDFDEIVDEYHADVIENGSGSSDWQNRSIGFLNMNVDLRPRLHEIQCPTLIIQGSNDIGIAPKHTRTATESIPNATFELIEGAGHWANRQCAETVNTLISAFLRP